jgi:hypothetical protein
VPLANDRLAIIDLPFDQVEAAGLVLLQVANHYRPPSLTGSLFDTEPVATPTNPRIELRPQSREEVLIAIDSGFFGSLVVKLDADGARDLRDSLTLLIAGLDRPE